MNLETEKLLIQNEIVKSKNAYKLLYINILRIKNKN